MYPITTATKNCGSPERGSWMSPLERHNPTGSLLLRYEALLAMADLLAHTGDVNDLFRDMTARLKNVVSFDFVNFLLHDPAGDVVRLNVWEGSPGPQLPIELPTRDTVTGWVMEHQQPMLCDTEQ